MVTSKVSRNGPFLTCRLSQAISKLEINDMTLYAVYLRQMGWKVFMRVYIVYVSVLLYVCSLQRKSMEKFHAEVGILPVRFITNT